MANHKSSTNSRNVQMLQAMGGGVSGAFTRFVSQPLDVLKIRFQLQVEPLKSKSQSKYGGMMHAIATIYREEGLRGMWRGHMAAQMMSITYALVQFWAYEQLKRAALEHKVLHEHMHFTYFMCGGFAGCLGTVVAQPFDVVRTRVVAADPGSQAGRLKPVSGVHEVFKKEGLRGVSSGMSLTLLQIYPLVGANFVVYKFLNHFTSSLIELYHSDAQAPANHMLPRTLLFFNGAVAGVIAKVIVYPADLIKKRSMLSHFQEDRKSFGSNPNCHSLMRCIKNTFAKEGLMGFYKGMMPTLFKSGIMSACYFSIYDFFNQNVTLPYQRHERELEQARQNEKNNKGHNNSGK